MKSMTGQEKCDFLIQVNA